MLQATAVVVLLEGERWVVEHLALEADAKALRELGEAALDALLRGLELRSDVVDVRINSRAYVCDIDSDALLAELVRLLILSGRRRGLQERCGVKEARAYSSLPWRRSRAADSQAWPP